MIRIGLYGMLVELYTGAVTGRRLVAFQASQQKAGQKQD